MNENKLIEKKYTKKDTLSLPNTKNKIDSDKKNPDIVDVQARITAMNEFVLSDVWQLQKEAKVLSTSKSTSMGNRNSPDTPNAMADECSLEKLERKIVF